jgi:hypothetical protein
VVISHAGISRRLDRREEPCSRLWAGGNSPLEAALRAALLETLNSQETNFDKVILQMNFRDYRGRRID